MTIEPAAPFATTPAPSAAAPASAAGSAGSGEAAAGGDALAAASTDFETFLTLLTAQMRNQDPLKPVESTEFVAQLASFSSVEQQIGTNERLDALMEAMTGGASAGLSEWIGREVRAASPTRFDGDEIEIAVSPEVGASAAALVVRDASGAEVTRLAVDPTAETVTWAGQLADGGRAADGLYGFEVEYASEEGPLGVAAGEVFERVIEIRLGAGDSPVLGLAGGGEVSVDDVAVLRSADAAGEGDA